MLNRSNRKKQFVLFPSYLLFFCSNEQKRLFRGSTDLLVELRSVNFTGKKWCKIRLEEHGLMTALHDLIGLVAPDVEDYRSLDRLLLSWFLGIELA